MNFLVTGATGALGRVVLKTLLDRGDRVVAVDRLQSPLGLSDDTRAEWLQADLSDPEQADRVMGQAASSLHTIDGIVSLVGAFKWIEVATSRPTDWWDLHVANVATTVNIAQAALPHLKAGASITCVGAASAQTAVAGMAPYTAAKSGVSRIVEALSAELKPRQIRVNAVAPGTIDTPGNRADMPDVDPANWTTPDAVADVIAFLTTDAARGLSGAVIPVTNNC